MQLNGSSYIDGLFDPFWCISLFVFSRNANLIFTRLDSQDLPVPVALGASEDDTDRVFWLAQSFNKGESQLFLEGVRTGGGCMKIATEEAVEDGLPVPKCRTTQQLVAEILTAAAPHVPSELHLRVFSESFLPDVEEEEDQEYQVRLGEVRRQAVISLRARKDEPAKHKPQQPQQCALPFGLGKAAKTEAEEDEVLGAFDATEAEGLSDDGEPEAPLEFESEVPAGDDEVPVIDASRRIGVVGYQVALNSKSRCFVCKDLGLANNLTKINEGTGRFLWRMTPGKIEVSLHAFCAGGAHLKNTRGVTQRHLLASGQFLQAARAVPGCSAEDALTFDSVLARLEATRADGAMAASSSS